MKIIFQSLVIIILVHVSNNLFSQNQTDSIFLDHNNLYKQNDITLNVNQLLEITKANPKAYNKIEAAQANNGLAMVLGGAGGFMIGWPLGTAMGGGEPKWILAGVGACIVAIAIPISVGAKRNINNGVDIYNAGLNKPPNTAGIDIDFNLGLSQNGIGIIMKF